MKKELVSVKDLNGNWTNILCVGCSAGKELITFDDIVNNIKECQEQLVNAQYIQEGEEIYVIVENMVQVNPGDKCK